MCKLYTSSESCVLTFHSLILEFEVDRGWLCLGHFQSQDTPPRRDELSQLWVFSAPTCSHAAQAQV